MARQNDSLEWEVLSEEEWDRRNALHEARSDAVVPDLQKRRLSFWHLWTIVLVALLLTGSGLYIIWRQAQMGLARINSELDAAVEAEAWRTDPHSSAKGKVTNVEMRDLSDGLAIVDVTTVNEAGNAYRYTQFYRQDGYTGWQRTSPDISFWGPEQSAETTYFRWYFRARDRVAVTLVAKQLDQVYLQLRHDLGLPAPSSSDKVIIEVQAAAQDGPATGLANHLRVSSPLLMVTPRQVSEVDALRAQLLLRLIQETLRSAQAQQPVWCIWRPLLGGLVQWQLHTYKPLLTDSPVLLAQDTPSLQGLLDRDENCLDRPVTRLGAYPEDPAIAALAETLFAYVVETHGRDGIATLLAAFRIYTTWEEALPAAFATSKGEFEAGWQKYVMISDRPDP